MSFSSLMPTRVPVRRVAHEGVTTERAILLTKEIIIHFGPALTLETQAVAGVGRVQELARSEGRPALGKRQRTKP
jgi:hypothetical protein